MVDKEVNLEELIQKIEKNEVLLIKEFDIIFNKLKEILNKRENIAILKTPINICGCINAHFEELKDIFKICGDASNTQYLFLGDYINKGFNSLSVVLLLMVLLVKYPNNITLLRGNHDSRMMSNPYGFYDECIKKYSQQDEGKYIFEKINELFDLFQLAAVIDNEIFCVHGGLSPKLKKIEEINSVDRKLEIPREGIITDLIWSDPSEEIVEYSPSPKGAGQLYGEKAVNDFIKENNNISIIIRSHTLVMEGYEYQFNKKLLTIFSAPLYSGRIENVGAVLKLDEKHNYNFIKIDAH